jgi:hypothetical protein
MFDYNREFLKTSRYGLDETVLKQGRRHLEINSELNPTLRYLHLVLQLTKRPEIILVLLNKQTQN